MNFKVYEVSYLIL